MTLSEIVFLGAWLLIVVSLLGHLHGRGIFPALFVGFAIFGASLVISSRARHTA